MCLFDLGVAAMNEALGLERQNIGNGVVITDSERYAVVACTARAAFSYPIWVIGLAGEKSFVNRLKMLKLLIVYTEKKRWDDPIRMTVSTPVLDRENCESLPQIALQRDAMKNRRIVCGRICRRIVEGREVVFKPTSDPPSCIVKRFVDIGDQLSSDRSQASRILTPDSQTVTRMGGSNVLVS